MGIPTPVAITVQASEYGKVVVETSDHFRYYADLRDLSSVYCFPKTDEDWCKVQPDSYGLALVWTTRFEVHMDQVVGLAFKTEPVAETA